MTINSVGDWKNNAELMYDVNKLGWITDDMTVLDVTYGLGRFWNDYRPKQLTACDIDIDKSPIGKSVDFTDLPWADREFDVVVYDPPYKLSGTPQLKDDVDYGIEVRTHWRDRIDLMVKGVIECARVCDNNLLVKCQDQVHASRVRWQTDVMTEVVTSQGFRKADRLDLKGGRPQPEGRTQRHSRNNRSTLLVFTRGVADNGYQQQASLQ